MHFNEMSVKSRQLGFSFIAAALGLAAFMLGKGEDFSYSFQTKFGSIQLHVSALLICISIIAILAIKKLDLGVYHRMLRGAVTFGEDFEQNHLRRMLGLEKGMTEAISHYSRYDDASKQIKDGRYTYTGQTMVTAEDKIKRFYSFVIWVLIASAAIILLVTNLGVLKAAKPVLGT
jgi:uncharacterized membrane protein YozB (DUF420 family)